MKINKKLLPMKAHYFLYNSATAPVVPFMPTLAKQLGFSTVIVGTIYSILPVVGMLAKPLFGAIADKYQKQKVLFLLFQVLTAISFFCIMFIPSIKQTENNVNFHCNGGAADIKYCPAKDNQLDKCLISQLENSNETVSCQMTCEMTDWMWETVCNYWNVHDICINHRNDKTLTFSPIVDKTYFETQENCLFFILHGGTFDGQHSALDCPSNSTNYFKTNCIFSCPNSQLISDTISETKISDDKVTSLYQFWLFFCFLIISWAAMAVVVSVGDAICFEMLGDQVHLYGNQRLWGSIGWGLFSIITGFLVDEFSKGQTNKNYSIVFYLTAVIIAFDVLVSSKLKHAQTKLSTNLFKDIGTIFLSTRVCLFFVWCVAVGLCTALVWNYLFWHLEDLASLQDGCDHLKWIKTLQGLNMGIQCFGGELPFFFLSGWILKKIGHVNAMSLVLLGFGVRFLLYSILTNPWWVLPIEFLNGITFGIFYSTMASYASIIAPPGTEATLQGLVGAIYEGVGVSLGSLFGGILFSRIGGSETFRLFGIAALICFLVHVLVHLLLERILGVNELTRAQYSTPTDAIYMLEDQESNHQNN